MLMFVRSIKGSLTSMRKGKSLPTNNRAEMHLFSLIKNLTISVPPFRSSLTYPSCKLLIFKWTKSAQLGEDHQFFIKNKLQRRTKLFIKSLQEHFLLKLIQVSQQKGWWSQLTVDLSLSLVLMKKLMISSGKVDRRFWLKMLKQ